MLGLALLAALAMLIHGYHLGADDAAIYVPAIKRVADPALYPFGAEFFMSHAHLSCFADLVAWLCAESRPAPPTSPSSADAVICAAGTG